MPIVKRCEQCGAEYFVKPYMADRSHYCSHSCSASATANARKPLVKKTCGYCGQVFELRACVAKRRKACSVKCGAKLIGKKLSKPVIKQCGRCKREYRTAPHAAESSRFCSRSCARPILWVERVCESCKRLYRCKPSLNTRFCSMVCTNRAYERMNAESHKLCRECKQTKPISDFSSYPKNGKRYPTSKCIDCLSKRVESMDTATREKQRRLAREKKRALRIECIKTYGGMCACCGETTIEFLCIDHINGGGNKHRKQIRGANIYYWLKQQGYPQNEYQILCHNCNMAKGFYGECPHTRGSDISREGESPLHNYIIASAA